MVARQDRSSEVLTVVTWNIQSGRGGLEAVATVLETLDPDIVGLNEVRRDSVQSGFVDQASALGRVLGRYAFFGPALNERYGNALLLSERPKAVSVACLPGGGEKRSCLSAALRRDSSDLADIQVLVTHLGLRSTWRDEQVKALTGFMAHSQGRNWLLLGDMNARPGSSELLPLSGSALMDVLTLYGEAPTFGDVRIDYIWASPGLRPIEAFVVDTDVSDHRPILARFMLDLE